MKRQKKSLYSLPVFKGRAVLGGLPPRMGKVYFGEALVEQLKQKGINVHEIGIRKENPLEELINHAEVILNTIEKEFAWQILSETMFPRNKKALLSEKFLFQGREQL